MTLSPGWNHQTPEVQRKFRDLINGAVEKQVPCLNKPEKWVDYDEDNPPDRWEANKMCFGCPLRALCKQVARETGVTYGVWGGEVYSERV